MSSLASAPRGKRAESDLKMLAGLRHLLLRIGEGNSKAANPAFGLGLFLFVAAERASRAGRYGFREPLKVRFMERFK